MLRQINLSIAKEIISTIFRSFSTPSSPYVRASPRRAFRSIFYISIVKFVKLRIKKKNFPWLARLVWKRRSSRLDSNRSSIFLSIDERSPISFAGISFFPAERNHYDEPGNQSLQLANVDVTRYRPSISTKQAFLSFFLSFFFFFPFFSFFFSFFLPLFNQMI